MLEKKTTQNLLNSVKLAKEELEEDLTEEENKVLEATESALEKNHSQYNWRQKELVNRTKKELRTWWSEIKSIGTITKIINLIW